MAESAALRRRLTAELRRLRAQAKLTQRQVADTPRLVAVEGHQDRAGHRPHRGDGPAGAAEPLRRRRTRHGRRADGDGPRVEEAAVRRVPGHRVGRGRALLPVRGQRVDHPAGRSTARARPAADRGVQPGRARRLPDAPASTSTRSSSRARNGESCSSGPTPPEAFFILDEAVLRRAVGGPKTMSRQIDHLVAMSQRPGGLHPGHPVLRRRPFRNGTARSSISSSPPTTIRTSSSSRTRSATRSSATIRRSPRGTGSSSGLLRTWPPHATTSRRSRAASVAPLRGIAHSLALS